MSYATGERVPSTGIYRVRHRRHRAEHEATLREGETFPLCQICGNAVVFESVASDGDYQPDHIGYDSDFMTSVLGIKSA